MKKLDTTYLTLLFFLLVSFAIFSSESHAQVNKNLKKSAFASVGNKWNRFRYGVMGQSGFDLHRSLYFGVGLGANQYYGVGNLMFQQSVCYSIYRGETTHHNFEFSIHNNFFGGFDFSPFVWGVNAMFVKDENLGQFFIRPDVGVLYPFSYRDKASNEVKYTIMLLYGYNNKLFQNRDDLGVGSHYITLKVLFAIYSYHEFSNE